MKRISNHLPYDPIYGTKAEFQLSNPHENTRKSQTRLVPRYFRWNDSKLRLAVCHCRPEGEADGSRGVERVFERNPRFSRGVHASWRLAGLGRNAQLPPSLALISS